MRHQPVAQEVTIVVLVAIAAAAAIVVLAAVVVYAREKRFRNIVFMRSRPESQVGSVIRAKTKLLLP